MLHFGSEAANQRKFRARQQRWRLWVLFAAACAVLWCMRMLQRPEISHRIDAVFASNPKPLHADAPDSSIELVKESTFLAAPVSAGGSEEFLRSQRGIPVEGSSKPPAEPMADELFDLSSVEDNTYFRSEENPAWFAVLDYLKSTPGEGDLPIEVTYAQLIDQPDTYRGRAVAIRGTAMREELLDAPENNVGIDSYHRLIIRPQGGGVWPIVVYCLSLPPEFPSGDKIKAEVEVAGIFFKNWSYSWQGGLGLAPVVLANTFDWQPPSAIERRTTQFTAGNIVTIVVLSAALATLVGWFAWRQTRRPITSFGESHMVTLPTVEDQQ